MRQLSGLDTMFLNLETNAVPMHIGGLTILDPASAPKEFGFDAVRRQIESRLHLLPTVTGFLEAYPDVAVDLKLTDRITHFLDDQIDVALRIGALPDSGLIATRVGEVRHVVCAAPDYLATHGAPATPDELARHRVISFESVSTGGAWPFRQDGVARTGAFRSRLSVNTIDAALDAGRAGAGLVRALSYQVNDDVRAGRLRLVLEDFEAAPRELCRDEAPVALPRILLRAEERELAMRMLEEA